MTVNIGIGQNRWLAKVAASFNKPDGLLTILPGQQEGLLDTMTLTDLPYINTRFRRRLNDAGIFTPGELYNAPYWVLFRQVFKSVLGHHWYLRLRGYETETQFGIKTVGRNYVLEYRSDDREEFARLLHKASAKLSRRLRPFNLSARGLMLGLKYASPGGKLGAYWRSPRWFERHAWASPVRRADQLYRRSMELFSGAPNGVIAAFDLTAYNLEPYKPEQVSLFEDEDLKRERLEDALHQINDRYGELTVTPASVAMSHNPMKDKIPFGTVRYFS